MYHIVPSRGFTHGQFDFVPPGMEDPSSARMEDCGVVDHEKLGGQWLAELGFSQQVCDLVARHVDGKRFQVAAL